MSEDAARSTKEEVKEEVDIFRDSPVRYLGYANEVGESFRALVHVNVVRFSYVVACAYVAADARHKGNKAAKVTWKDESMKRKRVTQAVVDTFIWQGLASVAIPGFTINRICFFTNIALRKTTSLPTPMRKWTTTFIGLGCIPLIIHPIDNFVDFLLNSTIRRWYDVPKVKELVHHQRDD